MGQILEADGVYLSFDGRSILSDVYIRCETGSITGLLGRNGAGKTCLLNVIYGRGGSAYGSVRMNGDPARKAYKRPGLLRYAPQFHFVPPALTLKRVFGDFEIDFGAFREDFPDLDSFYKTPVGKLSGGHRRLVEVYAVCRSPTSFALLDEPFSQLMPLHVKKLADILDNEKKSKGLLICDHLYRHVLDLSDRLFLLHNGRTHPVSDLNDIERLGYARL